MRVAFKEPGDWVDGFLFVANRPILDLLNTRPVLAEGPAELLPDFAALERWLLASGLINSGKTKNLLRGWRESREAAAFLKQLRAFRERLRDAVLRMESGSAPSDEFIREINAGLLEHPARTILRKSGGRVLRETLFEPQKPGDLWAPILNGVAELLSEPDTQRLRKCESCVVHFFDTSKKGSRRWCSMNICGNKLKVATYRRRKHESDAL
jgi:predicted RNA-binding Zn ribbon-like protein